MASTSIASGTRHTFPFLARRAYDAGLAGWADVLVEDINKVPLYTPRWHAKRTVALVPHLFGSTAFQEFAAPLAAAVWLAERPLGRAYAHVPFQAISESTADDLAHRGIPRALGRRSSIPASTRSPTRPIPPERSPTPVFAYLGRLKKYKGVHLVIRAFAAMGVPDAVLEIAGAGDYRPSLEALARSLDLGDRVRFLGRISEAEKLALLRRAWALVFASPKEGWGITNLEAAACATPVVASNSPGIRESVRDGETGFLVPHGDVARDGRRDATRRVVARARGDARAIRARVRRNVHVGARRRRDRATSGAGSSEQRNESATDRRPSARAHAHAAAARAHRGNERARSRDRESRRLESRARPSPATSSGFPAWRLQVLGETEITYLEIARSGRSTHAISRRSFRFRFPCVFITKGQVPTPDLVELAAKAGIALIRSRLKTNEFYTRIKPWLEEEFAPTTNLHGSLADVFGVGLLFVGQSGIGKSECVLDLVERGHRLVADDLVIARRRGTDVLIGRGHELQRHHMEIRGVGLVDIPSIFGIRAVRQQKRIEVVVQLEEWNQDAAGRPHRSRHGNDDDSRRRAAEGSRAAQSREEHHGHRGSHRAESSAEVQRHRSGRAVQRAAHASDARADRRPAISCRRQ